MRRLWYSALFLFLCLAAKNVRGTHIVGGELMYDHLHDSTYKIRLVLFVDCQNGMPLAIAEDKFACIGVFNGGDSTFLDSFFIQRTPPERINLVSYSCILPPTGACVDKYEYEKEVKLPYNKNGYILTFQRCCRNRTITNLIDPEDVASTYFTEILPDSVLADNSSPVFKNLPPNFVCVNRDLFFDHSATDIDGDSLVYEFYTPFEFPLGPQDPRPLPPGSPPYPLIPWRSPYNATNPMGAKSILTIDYETGLLHMKPSINGQFVVGIIVKEYRNGVQIGRTRRDYQFNVMPCQFNVNAVFNSNVIYCDNTVQFENQSLGDSFLWDFGVPGTTNDTSSAENPAFSFPGNGAYNVTLVSMRGTCMDTINHIIRIFNLNDYHFKMEDTTFCEPVELKFTIGEKTDKTFSYSWTPAEGLDSPNVANPTAFVSKTTTYRLKKVYKDCVYSDSFTVTILNPKGNHFAIPDTAICLGTSFPIGESDTSGFLYSWSPSTWLDRTDIPNPVSSPGGDITYIVTKSTKTCFFTDTVRIKVYYAKADFKTDTLFCDNTVDFTSNSTGSAVFWDFGVPNSSDDTSTQKSPQFTFPATGRYLVTHVATDGICSDTIRHEVTVLKVRAGEFAIPDTTICFGETITLGTPDTLVDFTFTWSPDTWLSDPTIANPAATPQDDITYTVTRAFQACVSIDTVKVRVRHPVADFKYSITQNCLDNTVTFENASSGTDRYTWYINDEPVSNESSPVFSFPNGTQVKGYLLASDNGNCPQRKDFDLTFAKLEDFEILIPNVITPNTDNANDCFTVVGFRNSSRICTPQDLHIYNRWGERVFSNPGGCWDGRDERNGNTLPEGVYYYVLTFGGKEYKGTITVLR